MARKIADGDIEIKESFVLTDISFPTIESDKPADQRVCWVTLLQEGPGNKRDRNYYERSVIEADSRLALQARKMYDGHEENPDKRSQRDDWLASIKETKITEDEHGKAKVRARIWVADPLWWDKIQGSPEDIAVSINGFGRSRGERTVEGQDGKWKSIVGLSWLESHDFVGSGGNVKDGASLTESDEPEDDNDTQTEDIKEGDDTLKFEDITLMELRKERADLFDALKVEAQKAVNTTVEEAAKLAEKDTEIATLTEENSKLKLDADARDVKEAAQKVKELRDTLLAEAKLPEKAITEVFKAHLDKQETEEDIKAVIEDRKQAVGTTEGDVKDSGNEDKRLDDKNDKATLNESLEAAGDNIFGQAKTKDDEKESE